MDKSRDPNKIFPDEVLALQKEGVPLPAFFAGPLYTGNGTVEALKALKEERAAARSGKASSTEPSAPDAVQR